MNLTYTAEEISKVETRILQNYLKVINETADPDTGDDLMMDCFQIQNMCPKKYKNCKSIRDVCNIIIKERGL